MQHAMAPHRFASLNIAVTDACPVDSCSPKPMVKGTLEGRSVVQVACGLTFSVLLTSDGA
jgi:hypothetical protein